MGVGGSIYKFGMAPAMGEPPDQFRRNEPRCPLTSALTPPLAPLLILGSESAR